MGKKNHPKNWIREIRTSRGITAKQLGAKVGGVTGEAITMIEKGDRGLSVAMAKRIAAALKCHYTEIIDGPGAPPLPRNEIQEQILERLNQLSDQEQELYSRGFLSGLNMRGGEPGAAARNATKKGR